MNSEPRRAPPRYAGCSRKEVRRSGAPQELIPVSEHQFMMRSLDFFKMEIGMGADGRAEKIVGYYSNGSRDESPRDE